MDIGARETIQESAGGDSVYKRVTCRTINGARYRFVYTIGLGHYATLRVANDDLGEQVHAFELGRVKPADMPGMVNFSKSLGKLLQF